MKHGYHFSFLNDKCGQMFEAFFFNNNNWIIQWQSTISNNQIGSGLGKISTTLYYK